MDKRSRIARSFKDSIGWLFFTSLIGMAQILLVYLLSIATTDIPFDPTTWFKNGAFITFALTLISAIFFDVYYQKQHSKTRNSSFLMIHDKYFGGIYFMFLPWIILVMTCVTTIVHEFADRLNLQNLAIFTHVQIAGVITSYFYAFYYKFCSFYIGLASHDNY
jgi:hypothetical protein